MNFAKVTKKVTVYCQKCGKPRRVLVTSRVQTKYCLTHARVQRSSKRRSKAKYAQDADFDRSLLDVEILENTEQFNRGARFSTTELRAMLHMGTILPQTHLRIKDSEFIVAPSRMKYNQETKLMRMELHAHNR